MHRQNKNNTFAESFGTKKKYNWRIQTRRANLRPHTNTLKPYNTSSPVVMFVKSRDGRDVISKNMPRIKKNETA
jgi:hypothetical protein